MKQFILPLVALMAMTAPAAAETTSLGYVAPGCALAGDFGSNKTDAWTSAAFFVPASTLRAMAGSQITVIKPGINSKIKCDALKVWIRTSLNGENIAEGTAETLSKGWSQISLDTPWTIPSDAQEGIYIGYSIHHNGITYPVSNTKDPMEGAFFVDINGDGWKDYSDVGSLCLEAVVDGDNLPEANLTVLGLEAPQTYVVSRGTLGGNVTVKNHGTKPVTSFDVSLMMDGDKNAIATVNTTLEPGGVVKLPFVLQPAVTTESTYKVSYLVDNLDSGEDADMADNSVERTLIVNQLPLERMAVIEEFTTERCPNCPNATYTINSYMHDTQYENRLATVCHHAGYYTDQFTTSFDEDYLWFFDSSGTFAPGMMIDRYSSNGGTPVGNVAAQYLDRRLSERYAIEPQLALDIRAGYEENNPNRLTVMVEGKKFVEKLCDNPAITIFLTENNIASSTQASGGNNFVHQHVGRAVNSTWGSPVTFDGDHRMVYTYTFVVNSNWKKDNLELVAMVHNKDTNSKSNWEVMNACKLGAKDFGDKAPQSGIDEIEVAQPAGEDGDVAVEYYTLDGIRVSADTLTPGLYIRRAGENVTKIVIR